MKKNLGTTDRLIRLLLAAFFAGLFYSGIIPPAPLATILWAIGLILIITAVIGFCPLYSLFKIKSTK